MPDYSSMLKADLEAEAEKRGIDISDGPLKDELIKRLEAYDAEQTSPEPEVTVEAAEDEPPEADTWDSPGTLVSVRLPTPYPSDDDLANRQAAAYPPELSPAPPPASGFE